ncbi:MAG: hypothetical protein ABIL62_01580 [Planctomycetota bacterium]
MSNSLASSQLRPTHHSNSNQPRDHGSAAFVGAVKDILIVTVFGIVVLDHGSFDGVQREHIEETLGDV